MAVEDFSFLVPARTIDSPRMWRRPTEEKTTTRQDHDGLEATTKMRVVDLGQRSFSCIETSKRDEFIISGFNNNDADDKGEKMDLLWESFNEELPRSQSSRVPDSDVDHRSGDRDQRLALGCVKAMKLSKTRSSGSNNHHHSAVVLVLRILKRLFTIHHHHHHQQHLHHQSKLKAAHAW